MGVGWRSVPTVNFNMVLLKVIRRGMDSDSVLARFLRERQILARLEHPNIARLLDGGVAADGSPLLRNGVCRWISDC